MTKPVPDAPRPPMSSLRKYYLFAAVVFAIGLALALYKGEFTSIVVFAVLLASMVWISSRVDRVRQERHPGRED